MIARALWAAGVAYLAAALYLTAAGLAGWTW